MAREFQFFRDAIVEHREEVRGGFAELVTRLERVETRCHVLVASVSQAERIR